MRQFRNALSHGYSLQTEESGKKSRITTRIYFRIVDEKTLSSEIKDLIHKRKKEFGTEYTINLRALKRCFMYLISIVYEESDTQKQLTKLATEGHILEIQVGTTS